MFFSDALNRLLRKYRVDSNPARPEASITCVNAVVPWMGPLGAGCSALLNRWKIFEKVDVVGDAGGEGRPGNGVCVHETETGLSGFAGSKWIASTLVCSYTAAPEARA